MIELVPIGFVRGGRVEARDDNWALERALIELDDKKFAADALSG